MAMTTYSPDNRTRWLLICGIVAGPFYMALAMGQALIREGFDLMRHSVSLLSNGDLGWIQIANFLVSGIHLRTRVSQSSKAHNHQGVV